MKSLLLSIGLISLLNCQGAFAYWSPWKQVHSSIEFHRDFTGDRLIVHFYNNQAKLALCRGQVWGMTNKRRFALGEMNARTVSAHSWGQLYLYTWGWERFNHWRATVECRVWLSH